MLYGTRKELNKKLKRMFGNNERFALLVWTRDEVQAQAEAMTEQEAESILREIGHLGLADHTEEGVSYRTVQALYAGLRTDAREVSVPADLLARLADIATLALSGEEAQTWRLVRGHYPSVAEAQAEINWLRQQNLV